MPGWRKPQADPDPGDVAVELEVEIEPEHEWRMLMLEQECGLDHFTAFRLSVAGCDWHDVLRLVRAGATPDQILEILLP